MVLRNRIDRSCWDGELAVWPFRRKKNYPVRSPSTFDELMNLYASTEFQDIRETFFALSNTIWMTPKRDDLTSWQLETTCLELIKQSPAALKTFLEEDRLTAKFSQTEGTGIYKHQRPPRNPGFIRLAAIRIKQGRFDEAIALYREAETQGWVDDWASLIGAANTHRRKSTAKRK